MVMWLVPSPQRIVALEEKDETCAGEQCRPVSAGAPSADPASQSASDETLASFSALLASHSTEEEEEEEEEEKEEEEEEEK